MSEARIFGTDGIRGRAGEGWLEPGTVSALGRAIGVVLGGDPSGSGRRRALLGHDGRRSGPGLEAALARGLRSAGYDPSSAGLFTTPGLAVVGRLDGYDVTVMVSASHNPARDNGIKIFDASGDKLADEVEDRIEAELRAHLEPVEAPAGAPALELRGELEEHYLAHIAAAAEGLELDGLSVVLDCANGGGSRVAPRALGRRGAQVASIAADPDGDNINLECGATHLDRLQSEVRRREADIGIALDGDGDRCMLVDERGQVVHGDGILTLLARHYVATGRLADPRIVATVMSNRGLHRALREVGVGVETVGVGDRRVVERLRETGLALGGEQSGHIVFGADNFHIGDGIYTALRVLRVMAETGSTLGELAGVYQPFPQVLLNVPVATKPMFSELPEIVAEVRRIEGELGEDGRVLLRYSGTEPLARVMVEGPDDAWIQGRAQVLAGMIAERIGT